MHINVVTCMRSARGSRVQIRVRWMDGWEDMERSILVLKQEIEANSFWCSEWASDKLKPNSQIGISKSNYWTKKIKKGENEGWRRGGELRKQWEGGGGDGRKNFDQARWCRRRPTWFWWVRFCFIGFTKVVRRYDSTSLKRSYYIYVGTLIHLNNLYIT